MAAMSLEYIFKVLILTVVAFVLITFVYNILHRSENKLNFCIAPFCKPEKGYCETKLIERESVDNYILKKYIDYCFEKGREMKDNCVCYTIKLSSPFDFSAFSYENTINECNSESTTAIIEYRFGEDKVHIVC